MTHDAHDHDFRQFAGRFDAPVAPSPAFAAKLRQRWSPLAPEPISAMVQPVAVPIDAVSPGRSSDDVPWHAPGWMRAFEAAVAVLLVVSLAGASLYFRQPEAVYNLAFQPEDPATAEFNHGGNAGRNWVLGDAEPEMGGFREDPSIRQLANVDTAPLIVGDSYISLVIDGVEHQLNRYDLSTQNTAWSSPMYITGTLASDGELIFGMRADNTISTHAATLVAIDFETGEIAWEGPKLANRFMPSASLAISGDAVYVTDYLGNVVAVDKETGTSRWQRPETFAVPTAGVNNTSGGRMYARPELAVNDDAVFVSQPSGAVLALDRETGEELGSINLVDEYGADIILPLIQVRNQHLVVTAIQAPRSEDPEAIRDYTPASILLFDAQTLELRSRTDVVDFRGNLVVTDKAIYVATAASVDDNATLRRLDIVTGSMSEPIEGVSARWDMALSASGNVLMATGDPSTIAFFNLETGELLDQVELGITGIETPIYRPVEMWGDNPIVITAAGWVYVVTDEAATG